MKIITAIIKPFKLDDVHDALSALGVKGMTVTEVKDFGRQKSNAGLYRESEYSLDFVPKLKVEIAVRASLVDAALDAITTAARTGRIGDGKIFVTPLERARRIRTGEADEDAL
jgi:nitrogen regulatory protein PII